MMPPPYVGLGFVEKPLVVFIEPARRSAGGSHISTERCQKSAIAALCWRNSRFSQQTWLPNELYPRFFL